MEKGSYHFLSKINLIFIKSNNLFSSRFDLEDTRLQILMQSIHESFRVIDMTGGILNIFPFIRHFMPDISKYRPLLKTLQPLWTFLEVK